MLTLEEILEATGGTLIQNGRQAGRITKVPPRRWRGGAPHLTGVSIDSRTLKRGNVFIAIEGKNFDGHRFIPQAVGKGASVLIVSREVPCAENIAVVRVKHTTRALGQIARAHRDHFNVPVIAITGSAGKTTTKDMTAAILGVRFKVLKNLKTLNNQYGVSLTLLQLNHSHKAVVLELGTNNPGEIRRLAAIARPTVAVLTNIGESHWEGLKNHAGVYREKSGLVCGLESGDKVIFNNDDPFLRKIHSQKRLRKITYGIERPADFRAGGIHVKNNRKICFHLNGHGFILNTPAPSYVYNALAAVACGRLFRIGFSDMAVALARLGFAGRRQQMQRLGGVTVIDDTYNSNPVSLRNALKTLDGLKTKGRKIFVTADMLELGKQGKALHRAKGRWIADSTIDVAITMGDLSRHAARSIRKTNHRIKVFHCPGTGEVSRRLRRLCRPGDIVLVKGSRGMRMERVVESLRRYLKNHKGS